jgi:peptide/nickel transport system ATP-binding protein
MTTDPKNGDILLDVKGLKIEGFADEKWNPIIKGVDLQLRRGEVLGLIGESGAGKSTLGLAAMGFVRAGCRITAGSAMFEGVDLVQASETAKRRLWGTQLTYVAQSAAASFNPAHRLMDQTIGATVRDGISTRAEAERDAVALYDSLMLPDPGSIGERFPHQVSGGQLQRVMTAMAMSSRPKIIVFDEPTTALDVTTQVEVLLAMRKAVREHGAAAIYITHDLAVVAQMADRIKVLRYGEEVEEAETREMLTNPQQDYTKSLWSVRALQKPAESSEDIVLSVDGVDAAYGKVKVLHDVSIALPRGKTVAIVGESGSGKSTTARVITGLLPPARGTVAFNGETLPAALQGRSKDQLRRIQMIYQMADTAMNPRQTVGEIIGRPLEFYHGLRGAACDRRVVELLQDIELGEEFIDRLPSELSGGQKQRICIARALAAEPDVIICDEVTSALDQIVQEGILKLLLKLQKEKGLSYFFITHDIAVVEAISDEIVVMNQGAVVEQGLKTQVINPPYPDYTELLLSSVPEMDPDWLTELARKRGFEKTG